MGLFLEGRQVDPNLMELEELKTVSWEQKNVYF